MKHGSRSSASDHDEAYFVNEIRAIHDHLDDSYGSPKLTCKLRGREFLANHKRIEQLVSGHGLFAKDARRRKL